LYASAAIWLLARYFPTLAPPASERVVSTDWLGIVLLATALISLQIILNRGEIDDWFGSLHIRLLAWTSGADSLRCLAGESGEPDAAPLARAAA
jgi:MFS transporter, DHA2 family, multidrug resistance protein